MHAKSKLYWKSYNSETETWSCSTQTSIYLLMQFASPMNGDQQIFLLTESWTFVKFFFWWFPHYLTWALQCHCWPFVPSLFKFVYWTPASNTFRWNLVTLYFQQWCMIMPDLMSLPRAFGILVMSKLSWMSGYSVLWLRAIYFNRLVSRKNEETSIGRACQECQVYMECDP